MQELLSVSIAGYKITVSSPSGAAKAADAATHTPSTIAMMGSELCSTLATFLDAAAIAKKTEPTK